MNRPMGPASPTRRDVVVSAAALAAVGAAAAAVPAVADTPPLQSKSLVGASLGPFDRGTVTELARKLAAKPYQAPPADLPASIANLTYDQYQSIYASPENNIFKDDNLPFRLQLFHRGFYYREKIDVAVVKDGQAYSIPYSSDLFKFGSNVPPLGDVGDLGFGGIRLLGKINDPNRFDEIAVFAGASYFRSLGKNQNYGLSARGLALNTAGPGQEEFPIFRAFWIEQPTATDDGIIVHALLDSVSVAGAYQFSIRPGDQTIMDVEVTLFPRVDLPRAGLAPFSSMFYFDGNGREGVDDFRPEVHDSNGLLMLSGAGETIWRPLSNPHNLQVSAFVDEGPRGFGPMQRNRDPRDYQDLIARYETRPSLWIEPVGDWGKGTVTLVEIPSDSEINDNIVAFWSPGTPMTGGSQYSFAYRLYWGDGPDPDGMTRVVDTRRGRAMLKGDSPNRRIVIDYQPAVPPVTTTASIDPKADVTASGGTVSEVDVMANPLINGWRLWFKLDPGNEKLIELRAVLKLDDSKPVETWLYRWTV